MDLDKGKYRTLLQDMKENMSKWRHIPCSSVRTINANKMAIIPKALYRFKAIRLRMPMAFLKEVYQTFLKFILNNAPP